MSYLDYICHLSSQVYNRTDTHQLLGNNCPVYNYCMYPYSFVHISLENMLK